MKNITKLTILLLILNLVLNPALAQETLKLTTDFLELNGPYLGQKSPGKTPELFADGLVSSPNMAHSPLAISNDGNDIAWFILDNEHPNNPQDKLYFSRNYGKAWSKPQYIVPSKEHLIYYMFFSEKDQLICLAFGYDSKNKHYIKFKYTYEKTKTSWEFLSRSNIGNSKTISASFNNDDFKIFDAPQSENSRWLDLFIKFKKSDGSMTEAINLGKDINTKWNEHYPSLSPDDKFLFFVRSGKYYWVDAKIITDLKNEYLNSK